MKLFGDVQIFFSAIKLLHSKCISELEHIWDTLICMVKHADTLPYINEHWKLCLIFFCFSTFRIDYPTQVYIPADAIYVQSLYFDFFKKN